MRRTSHQSLCHAHASVRTGPQREKGITEQQCWHQPPLPKSIPLHFAACLASSSSCKDALHRSKPSQKTCMAGGRACSPARPKARQGGRGKTMQPISTPIFLAHPACAICAITNNVWLERAVQGQQPRTQGVPALAGPSLAACCYLNMQERWVVHEMHGLSSTLINEPRLATFLIRRAASLTRKRMARKLYKLNMCRQTLQISALYHDKSAEPLRIA